MVRHSHDCRRHAAPGLQTLNPHEPDRVLEKRACRREARRYSGITMKTLPRKGNVSGLTLIELLVVICVIGVLAVILLPAHTGPSKARVPMCMSNQRQIALGLFMFQDDHEGKYPWQVSTANNGSLELVSNGLASAQFLSLASYFGNRPEVLFCPADKTRQSTTDFPTLTNKNISYFLNLDAITNANCILTGDRNLELNRRQVSSGIFLQTTNATVKWFAGFHGTQDKPFGVMSFADGHVQTVRQDQMRQMFQNQPLATNRFCIP